MTRCTEQAILAPRSAHCEDQLISHLLYQSFEYIIFLNIIDTKRQQVVIGKAAKTRIRCLSCLFPKIRTQMPQLVLRSVCELKNIITSLFLHLVVLYNNKKIIMRNIF